MAVRDPVMIAFDFVLDWTPLSVSAGSVHEPLLDEATGQGVELGNST
jgi:hypothetical protein